MGSKVEKFEKAIAKKKSAPIVKALHKADKETLLAALKGLGQIGDEDSCNNITHYLDHEDGDIRVAACEAALTINTEYMRTRVSHQLAKETDEAVKAKIRVAFNNARAIRV